jgi:PAS domain S-box-containing protein
VGVIWLTAETGKLREEMDVLTKQYFESKEAIVKKEVFAAIDYIEYKRSLSKERMKTELKVKVDEAWNIAENIYQQNIGKRPVAEIKKMIKDAIRPIRYANDRGDVFIYTLDGYAVMLPRSPQIEGKNGLDHQDNSGNFVVRNEVNLLNQVDWGYLDYFEPSRFSKTDSVLLKSAYVRKFEPLGWYFGTKDYFADFEANVKDEVLQRLSRVRFETDGYIFINTADGKALITNGEKLLEPVNILQSGDTNWIGAFNMQLNIFINAGYGMFEYNFRRLVTDDLDKKYAFVGSVKPWGWMVGAGFYGNEIRANIQARQKELDQKQQRIILRVFLIIVLLWIAIRMFSGFLTSRIINGFRLFEVNFRQSSIEAREMEVGDLAFKEFRDLGTKVNEITRELNITRKNLIKEQSLLRSIIDSIPDFVFFKDLQSNYVGCNASFSRYIGINEHEMTGRNDFDFFTRESAELYHENDRILIKENKPLRSEEWITMQDGRRLLMDTLKVLYYDKSGKALGILAISRDITESEESKNKLKEAKEKAEEADKLKTAFLANMSHEIRTPMNAIVGFSNLLTEDALSLEEKKEYISHINHGSETLLKLIDDIIDIAKIESGQLTVTLQPMNLKEMMDDLYTIFSNQLRMREKDNVRLIKDIADLPEGYRINSDEFRLRQVITNLVINAVKFTSEGSITYGLRLTHGFVEFYIIDTGIGISPEGQVIIFDRFRQENNGMKHTGGTGLGLAISKHIVELLGGTLSVQSLQGKGSEFKFTIPYQPLPAARMEPIRELPEKNNFEYDWTGKTLLVVEDVETNYKFIYAALSRTKLTILSAEDGLEAIQVCKENNQIDLILMDVNMPVLNGYDATLEIKKIHPHIPIVIQTAYAMQGEEQRSKEAGCDAFLSKPVNLNALFEILARFL